MSDLHGIPPVDDPSSSPVEERKKVESPWAVPRSLAPDSALLERTGFRAPDPKYDCVLLGPSGTGKSTLLGAMGRIGQSEIADGLDLSLLPGRALAELTGRATLFRGETSRPLVPADEPLAYDFQVSVHRRRTGYGLEQEVIVQDWPGRPLFGSLGSGNPPLNRSPGTEQWLQAAQEARCLVLCVDSMRPERRLWEAVLPQLLYDLSVSSGRLLPRLGRVGQWRLPPILSPKRQLPFQQVLILLTKIDQLCAAAAAAVLAENLPRTGPVSPFLNRLAREPWELASHLDPVRLVKDRLGKGLLVHLQAALAPKALFAAGLTSAWGFDGAVPPTLGEWSPFGVREAVLFLATGQVQHPVELMLPMSLEENFFEFGGRG